MDLNYDLGDKSENLRRMNHFEKFNNNLKLSLSYKRFIESTIQMYGNKNMINCKV